MLTDYSSIMSNNIAPGYCACDGKGNFHGNFMFPDRVQMKFDMKISPIFRAFKVPHATLIYEGSWKPTNIIEAGVVGIAMLNVRLGDGSSIHGRLNRGLDKEGEDVEEGEEDDEEGEEDDEEGEDDEV
ncbi:hypothetical protein AX17_004858 [Amanita inopinata Kibby_2008]|nr:hypothetical protein AX17_004858 [Amanita inopinata Kibby_2008]